jgi:hypothetical protein
MNFTLHPTEVPEIAAGQTATDEPLLAVVIVVRGNSVTATFVADVCRSVWCPSCHPDLYEFARGRKLP